MLFLSGRLRQVVQYYFFRMMASCEETEAEPQNEEPAQLSAAQRARIERNRQKALLLRQSRLQAHPYATDHLG